MVSGSSSQNTGKGQKGIYALYTLVVLEAG